MPKVSVTVQASAERPGVLDIREAMLQVYDFFELLSAEDDKNTLSWNLVFAGTNSPFTATAEAVSLQDGIDITPIANSRLNETSDYLSALSQGRRPHGIISSVRRKAARRFFNRNTLAVGKTTLSFDTPKATKVTLTPDMAITALSAVEKADAMDISYLSNNRERQEHGSIEGNIVDVCSDYNVPAIKVVERKSGRTIVCRVDQSVIDDISKSTSFKDVWEQRRVLIRGLIAFNSQGQVTRVRAKSITPINPRDMTLKDIEDKDFTGTLGINEYLHSLREGELG